MSEEILVQNETSLDTQGDSEYYTDPVDEWIAEQSQKSKVVPKISREVLGDC